MDEESVASESNHSSNQLASSVTESESQYGRVTFGDQSAEALVQQQLASSLLQRRGPGRPRKESMSNPTTSKG
jgi:hypothetical protein